MGFRRWYRHPRHTAIRKVFFQLHLWLGAGIGLYAALIGVTGSLLVFREDLQREGNRAEIIQAAPGTTRLTGEAAAAIMRRAYPNRRLLTFLIPQSEQEPYGAWMFEGSGAILVQVHPGSGQLIPADTSQMRFWNTVSRLHVSLLAGDAGHLWNGILAVLLLFVLGSGLALWWQGVSRWRRGLGVQFCSGWRRVNWDLHSAVGFWALPALFVVTLTGTYFVWPKPFRAAVSALSPVSQKGPAPAVTTPSSGPLASVDEIIAAARTAKTRGRPGRLNLSDSPSKAIRVVLYEGGSSAHHRYGYLFLDPVTLEVLRSDLLEARSPGDSLIAWLPAIHFGSFGGATSRTVWFILGLILPGLFISGLLMWWNRRLRRIRLRLSETSPPQERSEEVAQPASEIR